MLVEELIRVTKDEHGAIEKARNRTEKEVEEDVRSLIEWWKKQSHLPQCIFGDLEGLLLRLLQFNKFSIEKTKRKLEMFYACPHYYPEFFIKRDPMMIRHTQNSVIYVALPKLTADFGRICVSKFLDTDKELNILEHFKVILMICDLRMKYDRTQNDYFICDMKHIKLSHVGQINLSDLKNGMSILEKSYADAIKSIHVLNAPSFAVSIINFVKSLAKQKFLSRVYMHEKPEELFEFFPKEILPKDFGGEEKSLQELEGEWLNCLENQREFLIDIDGRQSNEKLRTEPLEENDTLGIQGSFRQLSVD